MLLVSSGNSPRTTAASLTMHLISVGVGEVDVGNGAYLTVSPGQQHLQLKSMYIGDKFSFPTQSCSRLSV